MRLFGWLKRKNSARLDPRIAEWRREWEAIGPGATLAAAEALRARLDALALPDDEIEIEREMLDALRELVRVRQETMASGLPTVQTGHRAIGTDLCHFTAPASMPDDEAQPSGRLLFTTTRAIFLGGSRTTSVPWHGVGQVLQQERDLVLVRKDREALHRFRCNSYADAMCGAFLAQQLASARQPRQPPLPPRT